MSESIPRETPSDTGYETKDLDPRTIALFAAGGAVVLLLAAALTFWMVQSANKRYAARQGPRPPAHAREGGPAPRLQVQGSHELRELRQAEETMLNSYAWIDRDRGIVRIPVERAMELLAKKGERLEATGASQKKGQDRGGEMAR
jgi:hypothetical protein